MVEIDRGQNANPEDNSERQRFMLLLLREVDLESEKDLSDYYRFLTYPANIEHFANPPIDPQDLKNKLIRDSTHAYLAENMLGQVVAGGGINDAAESEHDHFLVKVVVDPGFQGRGADPDSQGESTGRQFMVMLIEKAFSTLTNDGRERIKLDAAVIRHVDSWDRMPRLLVSLGFRPVSILLDQVDVFIQREGRIVRKPTERWELRREDWRRTRQAQEIQRMFQSRPL